jgi:hypothetical protein
MDDAQPQTVTCRCGAVALEASGPPILAASCYCADCRRAGEGFAMLPGAPRTMDEDGGTPCVLYRKDRVRCVRGKEQLQEHRLTPASPTRRVVAGCCNTPMFGDFTKGHWLPLYRYRFAGGGVAPQMRIMTRSRRADVIFADDVPAYSGFPPRFLFKLLAAWAAMKFQKPRMTF